SSLKAFRAAASSALSAAMARSSIALPSLGDANCGSAKDAALQAKTSPAHADASVLAFMCMTNSDWDPTSRADNTMADVRANPPLCRQGGNLRRAERDTCEHA